MKHNSVVLITRKHNSVVLITWNCQARWGGSHYREGWIIIFFHFSFYSAISLALEGWSLGFLIQNYPLFGCTSQAKGLNLSLNFSNTWKAWVKSFSRSLPILVGNDISPLVKILWTPYSSLLSESPVATIDKGALVTFWMSFCCLIYLAFILPPFDNLTVTFHGNTLYLSTYVTLVGLTTISSSR